MHELCVSLMNFAKWIPELLELNSRREHFQDPKKFPSSPISVTNRPSPRVTTILTSNIVSYLWLFWITYKRNLMAWWIFLYVLFLSGFFCLTLCLWDLFTLLHTALSFLCCIPLCDCPIHPCWYAFRLFLAFGYNNSASLNVLIHLWVKICRCLCWVYI